MPRLKNLTGKRVGSLVVKSLLGMVNKRAVWKCRCDCGETAIVTGAHLCRAMKGDGGTKSCGCLRKQNGFDRIESAREAALTARVSR